MSNSSIFDHTNLIKIDPNAHNAKKEYHFGELITCNEEDFEDCVKRKYYKDESCLKRHIEEAEQNGTKIPEWAKAHRSIPQNLYKQFFIITKIFEQWVPMVDCDKEDEKNEAIEELQKKGIPYVIFNSSSNHYWIFCDKLTTLDKAVNFIYTLPGDHRYPWCSSKRGSLVVRALPKNLHLPIIGEQFKEEKFSKHFRYWIKCFEEHWHTDLMEWILSRQVVEAF